MEEEILEMIAMEIDCNGGIDERRHAVSISKEITEMITDFIEWCATTHIKLHKVWCGLYRDQRNEANWKTTEELFHFWNTNIRQK
jgi:hypothetical protein